ncbi:HET-domain-containing protein [Daldinia grandis]|nr:HET-domain-containing protein [Daldinia grandis]
METDKLFLPKRSSVYGARSDDLSTAWSNPKFMPHYHLSDWRIDWDNFINNLTSGFGVGYVVYTTILSVLITSTIILTCKCETITLDIEDRERILINPLNDSLPNREYEVYYNSPISKGLIEASILPRRWVHSCMMSYGQCALALEPYIPSRLLDVPPRILDYLLLRCDIPKYSPVVALSHFWGGSQHLKAVEVTMTKILGLRFLWIDSPCVESTQIGKTCGNPKLVLATSVASSAHDSFLRGRPYTSLGYVSVRVDSQPAPVDSIYRIVPGHISHLVEPLDHRGWAFQERFMTRRYLSYGTNGITFDKFNLEEMLASPSPWDLTTLWVKYIVVPYTRRQLTAQSDKLVGLSTVASQFQSYYYGGTYLAGLWGNDLICGLLWMTRVELSTENMHSPVSSGSIQLCGRAVQARLCNIGNAPNNCNGPLRKACKISGTQWAVDCWLDMPLVPYGSILGDTTERAEVSARRIYFTERNTLPKAPTTYTGLIFLMAARDMYGDYNGLMLSPSPKQVRCFGNLGLASRPWGGILGK